MRRFLLKRLWFIPLGVVAYLATLYAQGNPDWTEQVFSRSVYPVLSSAVGFLPSLVSFSVAEWLAVLFLLFCLGYVAYYVRKIIVYKDGGRAEVSPGEAEAAPSGSQDAIAFPGKTKADPEGGRGMIAYRGAMGAVAIVCVVYFLFTFLCGLNYYRYTFTHYTGYDVEQTGQDASDRQEELVQLCESLAGGMGAAREELGDGTDLYDSEPGDFERYAHESVSAIQELAKRYPVLDRPLYSPPKPVLMSELMSDANIGGIFIPFTMESNINIDGPFFSIPSTMVHELAHQCGFMREDEANFIAYLACKESSDPLMRYSGLLLAFDQSLSALRRVDPERASEIRVGLPEAVQRDMAQRARFWAEHEGVVSDVSNAVNDTYLKANNQAHGVQSYGRMVELLLAEQRAESR